MVGIDGKRYPVINQRAIQRTSNFTALPEKEIEGYVEYFCKYIKEELAPSYGIVQIPYMGNLKPQYKRIRYLKWLEVVAKANGYMPKRGTPERQAAYHTIMNKQHGTKTTDNGRGLEDHDSQG